MMEAVLSDLLSPVNDFLSEKVGLYFGEKRFSDLERGLHASAIELGFQQTKEFVSNLLDNKLNKSQLQSLVRNLTIGETYFFRDPAVFVLLEEKLIAEAVRRSGNKRELRIWSAGCSTGEEPYSICISLLRTLKSLDHLDIKILATDINTCSLEKAKAAQYTPWSFRAMPDEFSRLYFDAAVDGVYPLKQELRKPVHFDYLNLAEDHYPSVKGNTSDMDIIFCRNVLIYFTQKKSKEILDKLSACLKPGGVLVTSANDSARFIAAPPEKMERISSTMFRKKEH